MDEMAKDDRPVISYCGLYCEGCQQFLDGKCSGCVQNSTLLWCRVRMCCIAYQYQSCAQCRQLNNITLCEKLNECIQNRTCACHLYS
jgi:hypothetical protein